MHRHKHALTCPGQEDKSLGFDARNGVQRVLDLGAEIRHVFQSDAKSDQVEIDAESFCLEAMSNSAIYQRSWTLTHSSSL